MRANLQIRDNMQALKIMIYPFIEQMKSEIEQADGKGTKQMIADVVISTYCFLKDNGLLSARDIDMLESFDIPYIQMIADGVTLYPVQ